MWTLVLFFGCSILFGALRRATEGESTLVVVGVQVLALGVVVVGVAVAVRKLR